MARQEINTLRAFDCPECRKRRLHRPHDFKQTFEKTKTQGLAGEIEHYVHMCEWCDLKLKNKLFPKNKKSVKRLLNAMRDHGESDAELETSLEHLL